MKVLRPETGYGYIAAASEEGEIRRVKAFKEKPDLDTAKKYLQAGNYYWNAGLFIWNVKTIEMAFRFYQPKIAEIFDKIEISMDTISEQMDVDKIFPSCPSISIDYAIMEKADDIYVFPADFGWSDLGTWGSLHNMLSQDSDNNACVGSNLSLIESKGCIIHMPENKKVVIQGLNGYIVAEKDNTLLICRLEDEQRIKEFSK